MFQHPIGRFDIPAETIVSHQCHATTVDGLRIDVRVEGFPVLRIFEADSGPLQPLLRRFHEQVVVGIVGRTDPNFAGLRVPRIFAQFRAHDEVLERAHVLGHGDDEVMVAFLQLVLDFPGVEVLVEKHAPDVELHSRVV